uniref:peptidylprolyl isomerase n=1 Tax=uncultured organism TaxID=155900 RepID=M1PQN6_9ZZZZ|nr:trigger factor [uncultured organism]
MEVKGLKSTIKERKDTEVTLEVTIDSNTVNNKLDEIFNKTVDDLDLPGFRKGKVPKSFVKARFGDDVFYEDAQKELIDEYLQKALEENDINPVSQPETETKEFERGEDFTFEASIEVMPEVELEDYTDIEVADPGTGEVTEEEIEERLHELQEENGQLVPKEDGEVEAGDHVTVSDPDGNTQEVQVSEDEGNPTHDLIGKSVGDRVEVTAGEAEESPDLTVEGIKEQDLPPLDDEFAKDLGHDDLESLRTDVKSDLFEEKEEQRSDELGQRVLDKIIEKSDVSPPKKMLDNIVDNKIDETREQIGSESFNDLLEEEGKTEEDWKNDVRESTEEQLKERLVLDRIAELEDIELSDEEFEEELEEEADKQGANPIKLKNQLKAQDRLESYRDSLVQEKVFDFLIDSANLIEEEDKDE